MSHGCKAIRDLALDSPGALVTGQDGSRVVLADVDHFDPRGWLDAATVIGVNYAHLDNLSFVRLTAPGTAVDLGFKGKFVGTVQT